MSDSNSSWHLTYVDQTGALEFKDLIVTGKFLVGREQGNLKIGTGAVSRRHIELEPQGNNRILIQDLRSSFGSVVATGLSTSPFPWTQGGYQRYLLTEDFFVAVSKAGLEWETDVTVTRIENGGAISVVDRALVFFPGGILIAVSSSAKTSRAHSIGAMPGRHLSKSRAYSAMTGHASGVWEIFKRCGCGVIRLEDLASISGLKAMVPQGECGPFSTPIIKGLSATLSGQEFCEQLQAAAYLSPFH